MLLSSSSILLGTRSRCRSRSRSRGGSSSTCSSHSSTTTSKNDLSLPRRWVTIIITIVTTILVVLPTTNNNVPFLCEAAVSSSSSFSSSITVTAFAAGGGGGGFGGGGGSSTTNTKKKATKKKPNSSGGSGFGGGATTAATKKKKKRGNLFREDNAQQTREEAATNNKMDSDDGAPKLDRFGLPVLTADNFFPPLPAETELIPMAASSSEASSSFSLEEMKQAMREHLPFNYDIFDANGIEKIIKTDTDTEDTRKPWKLKCLHVSPPVFEIEHFFTAQECQQYKEIATPTTQKKQHQKKNKKKHHPDTSEEEAVRVNSATFGDSDNVFSKRTSTTWYCYYKQVPTLLAKATRLLGNHPHQKKEQDTTILEKMEEAQIVRYKPGEEFSWHYDEIPTAQLDNGGQRVGTLLVYLNDMQGPDGPNGGGGATIFRDLTTEDNQPLQMIPKAGSALLFFPSFADGRPDDRTLHKGEVVQHHNEDAREPKMIAQIWIHEKSYQPVIPRGNNHQEALPLMHAIESKLGYDKKRK